MVELFRSRAELRKQHDELGAEMQRLRDRLKQQEAATARVQEMFETLEKRLESADTGLSTLVFYHLRALWADGREIIGMLVQDLAAKQEDRERKAFALEGNRKQFQQRQASEQQLRQAESLMVAARQQLAAFDAHVSRSSTSGGTAGSGRRSPAQRPALQAAVGCRRTAHCTARGPAASRSRRRAPVNSPEFPSRPNARSISPPSPARKCCACGSRAPRWWRRRAPPCRNASQRNITATLPACVSIMSDIVKARNLLKQRSGIMQEVAQRTERLRCTAAYLGECETVPIPESCGVSEGDVLAHGSQGVTAARLPNVVAEDTWDLFKVLLR